MAEQITRFHRRLGESLRPLFTVKVTDSDTVRGNRSTDLGIASDDRNIAASPGEYTLSLHELFRF